MSFEKIDRESEERKIGRNCILVYGYNAQELELIELCRQKSGIDEIVVISESEIHKTLGTLLEQEALNLANLPVAEAYTLIPTIIFSGTSHSELDRFIEASKKVTMQRPIFAGTTPHNLTWAFSALVEELIQEREEMKKMRAMKS
ncbi:DUF3783 domain-containing protein [Fusibacter ferrireducens]|uniref:DUF3783 domain-containing protein n=1 Tax=Fusibacter ferrireducens TaxID=2785058 RepID=A0ABR9ZVD6_9FIRM|nr:DUF3783 domain-containing protein [Fusibacter ferrireducens]MBF4694421.1 DUF3783 domain-containing protein [Fusibacter ferrireducens]